MNNNIATSKEEILKFFENLGNGQSSFITKSRMYYAFKSEEERSTKEIKVYNLFKGNIVSRDFYSINFISETEAIVKWTQGSKTVGYMFYIEGMPIERIAFSTYDEAVLAMIFYKNNPDINDVMRVVPYISKMFNIKNSEKYEGENNNE